MLLHRGFQLGQGGVQDHLVRPGRLGGHHDRCVLGVAAGAQLLGELPDPCGGQDHGHGAAVAGQLPDALPLPDRARPAGEPGENNRLRDLRKGQFPADRGRRGGETGHPGHDLGGQAQLGARVELLPHPAPQGWITGQQPDHVEAAHGRAAVDLDHLRLAGQRGVHELGGRAGVLADALLVHQVGRPHHDVGLGDPPGAAQRDQVRGAGTSADEGDSTAHLKLFSSPTWRWKYDDRWQVERPPPPCVH